MPERNLCKEAGCAGCCCHDSYFHYSYPVRKVLEWFPNAKHVSDLSKQTENGVYYTNFLGTARVGIIGPCPNLSADGNCQINDWKPLDCLSLAICSKACSLFRRVQEQGVKMVVK